MASNRIVRFEMPANDPQALAKFYSDLFGWTCTRAPNPAVEYWNVDTGAETPGINGGIVKRQHAQHPCMNYADVASLDAAVAKATELGARVALPKTPIPGVGMMACLVDPEGHVFGLIERSQA